MLDDVSQYVLAPERDVRASLSAQTLSFTLLRPPYPALGVGQLRVLRIREGEASTELIAGYERYERYPG